mgnify:CR=1 FL=1
MLEFLKPILKSENRGLVTELQVILFRSLRVITQHAGFILAEVTIFILWVASYHTMLGQQHTFYIEV